MPIINYKPTSAARRNMSVTDYTGLSKNGPEKSLLAPLDKKAGRNSYGRITVRHRGGGNRKKYRIIDFKRQKHDMEATVLSIEYDPNRSAFIALVQYEEMCIRDRAGAEQVVRIEDQPGPVGNVTLQHVEDKFHVGVSFIDVYKRQG